jgi:hypothetical protein
MAFLESPNRAVGDPLREWESLIPQATNGSSTSVEVILPKARLFNYLPAPLTWHGSWYRVPGRRAIAVGMSEEQRAGSVFWILDWAPPHSKIQIEPRVDQEII